MKKMLKLSLSVLMSILMILSVLTPAFPAAYAKGEIISSTGDAKIPRLASGTNINVLAYQPQLNITSITMMMPSPIPGPSVLQNLCKGAVSWVATRAVQEMTSLVIKSDIPVLSKLVVCLQDPATRAELQHKQLVQEIAVDVKEIKASVARIESTLSSIQTEGELKATAEYLLQAGNRLNDLTAKYKVAWSNYEAIISWADTLKSLEEQYPDEASRTQAQKDAISDAEESMNNAINLFIRALDEGSGASFYNDIINIPAYIWDPADRTKDFSSSYLGALEDYLRLRYAYEHEITEQLMAAFESCYDLQMQMYIIYREYTMLKAKTATEAELAEYDEFFAGIQYAVTANVSAMAESFGFSDFLIAEKFTDERIAQIKEIDPDFVSPETIDSSITVDGKTYNAYKVRNNSNLNFYKIITDEIAQSEFVDRIYSDATNVEDLGIYIYKPTLSYEKASSDDGIYKLISSAEELALSDMHVNSANGKISSLLRNINGINLSKIPSAPTHLLLYSDNFAKNGLLKPAYWQVATYKDTIIGTAGNAVDITYVDSDFIYDNSVTFNPLLIYRDITDDTVYTDSVSKYNDTQYVNNRTFVVGDGQTLDFSLVDQNISNVNIIINGTGTVVSNPEITLTDSSVLITALDRNDTVTLKNLNVTARAYEEAALTVRVPSTCNVAIEGSCSFSGNAPDLKKMNTYKYYNIERPAYASHGILIDSGYVTLVGVSGGLISYLPLQSLTATGAGGGAGICHNGTNLTIKALKVVATGSQLIIEDRIGANEMVYAVGAGIGASMSCVVNTVGAYSVDIDADMPVKGNYINDDPVKANVLSIEYSDVTAKGAVSTLRIPISDSTLGNEIYSEDIGGVKIPDDNIYNCFGRCDVSNSTVNLKRNSVTTNINSKNGNNIFVPEVYSVYTYTKGSNGVTTDGVYFKLYGEKGTTDWILASNTGNSKGAHTDTIKGTGVGKINYIEVKTKSSNHWYPSEITITGKYNGDTITVYGGRWIGNSGTALYTTDNIYKVTVNTGTGDNSGTDSDISLYLEDNDGTKTENIELSDIHQDSNAFEKGDTDTFLFYAPKDFGECNYAFFNSDHSGAAAGWNLDSFTVEKIQGAEKDSGFTFYSGQWFEESKTICFGKYSGHTGSFLIEVKTSDINKAGTDSDIYLTIYGDKGDTGEINLDTYAGSSNNFEKGELESFYIGCSAKDIGNINHIKIRKNDSGVGPDWHLEYIKITEITAKDQQAQSVTFVLDQWIKNKTYDFYDDKITTSLRTQGFIDREILKGLTANEDGSYTLIVNRNVNMTHEVFDFLIETGAILTVEMHDDDGNMIYSVTFDGTKITNHHNIVLKKSYSLADGNAIIDFVGQTALPAGTILKINAEFLDIGLEDTFVGLTKDENGEWTNKLTIQNENGVISIPVSEGKQILININGAQLPSDTETESENDETCDSCGKVHTNFIEKVFCFFTQFFLTLFRLLGYWE